MIKHQYKLVDDGDWSAVDITGYPFKDFYHFKDQTSWMNAKFGDPTYIQPNLRVYQERESFVSVMDDFCSYGGGAVFRFGFSNQSDAMAFYLTFV